MSNDLKEPQNGDPKLVILPQNKWPKKNTTCQADCVSSTWAKRHYGKFPKCKHEAMYAYNGTFYCSRHLGLVLIQEKIDGQ
jgi:hypothetical protein